MDRRYKHLSGEERGVILAEHRRGASLRAIGVLLGRSASTIGQELRRGRLDALPAQPYCAQLGGAGYRARRKHCGRRRKLSPGGWLHDFVRGKLIHRRWSPTQKACKLKAMHPDDQTRLFSHAAIYAAICASTNHPAGARAPRCPAAPSPRNRCGSSIAPQKSRAAWCRGTVE